MRLNWYLVQCTRGERNSNPALCIRQSVFRRQRRRRRTAATTAPRTGYKKNARPSPTHPKKTDRPTTAVGGTPHIPRPTPPAPSTPNLRLALELVPAIIPPLRNLEEPGLGERRDRTADEEAAIPPRRLADDDRAPPLRCWLTPYNALMPGLLPPSAESSRTFARAALLVTLSWDNVSLEVSSKRGDRSRH